MRNKWAGVKARDTNDERRLEIESADTLRENGLRKCAKGERVVEIDETTECEEG